jgi:hypothetical protein
VLLVLAVSYASSARAWLRQRSEINQLTSDIEAQRASIADLEQEKRRLNDPAYIKALGRERFGWVMPGETGYRVIGEDGKVIADSGASLSEPVDPTASTDAEWWDTAWGSVEAAGREPGAPDTADGSDPATAPADDPASHIGRNGHERPVDPGEGKPGMHSGSGETGGSRGMGEGPAGR